MFGSVAIRSITFEWRLGIAVEQATSSLRKSLEPTSTLRLGTNKPMAGDVGDDGSFSVIRLPLGRRLQPRLEGKIAEAPGGSRATFHVLVLGSDIVVVSLMTLCVATLTVLFVVRPVPYWQPLVLGWLLPLIAVLDFVTGVTTLLRRLRDILRPIEERRQRAV